MSAPPRAEIAKRPGSPPSKPDREAARLAAIKACEKGKAGECIVRVTDCNK
jgi:hypothetical protein